MREIEKVIRSRHGYYIPETDDADIYIKAAALSLSAQDMIGWTQRWAPWATEAIVLAVLADLRPRRRMISAEGCANLLKVGMAERRQLKLRTIGAFDLTPQERLKLAKEIKREGDRARQEQKRKASGRRNRASYEEDSLQRLKPWEALGISRATWYRRRETSLSPVEYKTDGDTPVSNIEMSTTPSGHSASVVPLHPRPARPAVLGLGDNVPDGATKGQSPMGQATQRVNDAK
ncbi:hypothetical protein NGM99_21380 [Mesorhizobium sp. RP14(2022)]|uniref:DUF1376 domain-containing protein n=1 Tax=Mesorhizobium liriopis TaxID=2953882 RepID=A0ABT1CC00_9HYPH|nr:hypothetical protein [Mesorhizobium liriopis]MCO6052345.1 hypothetical protein [Mesorhizobium liriopis]